jgi:hypothetical protein
MDFTPVLILVSILMLLGYLAAVRFLAWRHLTPFARGLFIALTVVELTLAGLHTLTWGDIPPFWKWLFDLDGELQIGSIFSSTQFLAVGLIAFVNGLRADVPRLWHRLYWWFVAAVFIYFSLDEYYMIHEGVGEWQSRYAIAGAVFIGISLAAYRFGFGKGTALSVLFFGGLGIFAVSAIGFEPFIWHVLCRSQLRFICHKFLLLEEFFEMAGSTVIFAGFISDAQARLGDVDWRLAKRVVTAGSAVWCIWLIGNFWPLPAWQARLLAEPVEAEYLDGTLSLVGYRVTPDVVAPGGELNVTLYWRANDFLTSDYGLSVHMLAHPEISSVAQFDEPLTPYYPDMAWLPGVVVKETVHLSLPGDLPAPRSYWLMVRIWHEWQEVTIVRTDRMKIAPDALILGSVPTLSDGPLPQPQTPAGYHFAAHFTLYGYTLPERAAPGQTLPLVFWWRTGADIDRDFTQFVHLLGSEGTDFYSYDRQPFDGAFPTSDWPEGIEVMDEWGVLLPDDLPGGEYRVYTGMYEWPSLVRQQVTDGQGQPVGEDAIYLGTVVIEK